MGLALPLLGFGFVALILGQLLLRLIEGVELFTANLRDGGVVARLLNRGLQFFGITLLPGQVLLLLDACLLSRS